MIDQYSVTILLQLTARLAAALPRHMAPAEPRSRRSVFQRALLGTKPLDVNPASFTGILADPAQPVGQQRLF